MNGMNGMNGMNAPANSPLPFMPLVPFVPSVPDPRARRGTYQPNHPQGAPMTIARTHREMLALQPKTAKDIGIPTADDWPYGPNIDDDSRKALVKWARNHNLRLARRAWCSHWIIGQRCYSHSGPQARWEDHVTGWNLNRQRAVLVAQPYPDVDEAEVHAYAEAHGLRAHIDPAGGWYGGRTVFVAVYDPAVIDLVTA